MDATQPPGGQPPQRSSFSSLLFITLLIFLLSGNGNNDPTALLRLRDSLRSLNYQHSNYTAWINGTESNFTLHTEPITLPPLLRNFLPVPPPIDPTVSSYYQNITGFQNGPAQFYNLTSVSKSETWKDLADAYVKDTNFTAAQEQLGGWKWKDIHKVGMNLRETRPTDIEGIHMFHGEIDLQTSTDYLKFQFRGVHALANGTFFALAERAGSQPDIRQLPGIVPPELKNATIHGAKLELENEVDRIRKLIEQNRPEESSDFDVISSCPFHIYGQLADTGVPAYLLEELEHEMEEPTGITTIPRPDILLNAVLISHDCAVMVTVDKATGLRSDRLWRKAITYAGFATVVQMALILVLVRQMEASRTPTSISPVSWWMIALQLMIDGYLFISHVTVGLISDNRASLPLITPGILAGIMFFVFEARYASLIQRVQGPENEALAAANNPVPTPRPPTPVAPSEGTQAGDSTPTLRPAATTTATPTTTPTVRTPLLTRITQTVRTTDSETKFWIATLLSVILIAEVFTSPSFMVYVLFLSCSFWVPQIIRSAKRGVRKALRKEYIIITSICRLFYPVYVYGCPYNILFFEPVDWIWLLVAWLWLQVLILLGQDYLGPTFFVPKGWISVETYDYHPTIPLPDAEAPKQSLGDCSICLDDIIVHPEVSEGGAPSTISNVTSGTRKSYAVAPCSHMFHTECLEQWLAIKNICPKCRRPLPPL